MAKGKQMKHKAKAKKKGIKKRFYEVEIPMCSAKVHLYGSSVDAFNGKVVKIDLTRSLRGKSFELRAKIKSDGEKLTAETIILGLIMSYIRRVMRKGVDYVEDSFEIDCRNKKVKIKPFMITRKKVSRAVRNNLRENARKYLESKLKTRTDKEIFAEIMANKLQKELSLKLKKIYPLAFCEIRVFEVVGEKSTEGKVEKEKTVDEEKVEKKEVEEEVKEEKFEKKK